MFFWEVTILSTLLVDKEETIQIVDKEVHTHFVFVLCCSFNHCSIQVLEKFGAEPHISSQVLVWFQDIDNIWLHKLSKVTMQLFHKHLCDREGACCLVLKQREVFQKSGTLVGVQKFEIILLTKDTLNAAD